MKLKIRGEHALAQIRQSIFEQLHQMEDEYAIRYMRDVTIYMTPTNGFGDRLKCKDGRGDEVGTICVEGPYDVLAEEYNL